MTSADILALQRAMNAVLLSRWDAAQYPPDKQQWANFVCQETGDLDPATYRAVNQIRFMEGLPQNGSLDSAFLQALQGLVQVYNLGTFSWQSEDGPFAFAPSAYATDLFMRYQQSLVPIVPGPAPQPVPEQPSAAMKILLLLGFIWLYQQQQRQKNQAQAQARR